MKWTTFLVVALFLLTSHSSAERILGIFPIVSKSHWAFGSSILKVLIEAGHDVTVISPFTLDNATSIQIMELHKTVEDFSDKLNINGWDMKVPIFDPLKILAFGSLVVPVVLENDQVKQLMKDPRDKFDLVIMESFASDTFYSFGEYFNAPVISVFPSTATGVVNMVVGNPEDPSYVPSMYLSYTPEMSIYQRVGNYLMQIIEMLSIELYSLPLHEEMARKYFPNNKKSVRDAFKEDVALAFVNTHFSLSYSRPYVPNMIEIGGLHIDGAGKKLPDDLQHFMDTATDGVVLFSMGSLLQASDFSEEQRNALISALGKLKQRVIWRYNLPDADKLPKNILTKEWLPQRDILAHPNVRLFITHGGMLGTTEGVYHGVPMIGISVFGDQHLNIARAVNRGYALKMSLDSLSEELILSTIYEIIENPKYRAKAKELSGIFKDRPMNPKETALYWSEYVMRHKGAKHMQVESQNLSFWAYHGLDVLGIVLVILIAVVIIQITILKWTWRKLFGGNKRRKVKRN